MHTRRYEKETVYAAHLRTELETRSKDMPATQSMLKLVKSEVKADVRELSSEMKEGFKHGQFHKVDARFSEIEAKFDRVDARFSEMESRFDGVHAQFHVMNSKFDEVQAQFHQMNSRLEHMGSELSRMGILLEEQNSRNRIVLEGLSGLWHRQDRVGVKIQEIETTVQSLGRHKP